MSAGSTRKTSAASAQPGSDAVTQFLGGGIGEGDDQDLGRGEGAWLSLGLAMTEHQADVEGRDGEGLAGTGAGLDQTAAVEGKTQGIECLGDCLGCSEGRGRRHVHAATPLDCGWPGSGGFFCSACIAM